MIEPPDKMLRLLAGLLPPSGSNPMRDDQPPVGSAANIKRYRTLAGERW
jgi:hypothetical protein